LLLAFLHCELDTVVMDSAAVVSVGAVSKCVEDAELVGHSRDKCGIGGTWFVCKGASVALGTRGFGLGGIVGGVVVGG
jgi:hypothetical protein